MKKRKKDRKNEGRKEGRQDRIGGKKEKEGFYRETKNTTTTVFTAPFSRLFLTSSEGKKYVGLLMMSKEQVGHEYRQT